jgi:hypothetical protein
MPDAWIAYVLSKLSIRYGDAFSRQYAGLDPEVVRADWQDTLAGLSAEALQFALDHCPSHRPPNVLQFRDLARQATRDDRQDPKLPAPAVQADPANVARVRAQLERLRTRFEGNQAQRVVDRLREIERDRGLSERQREVLALCLARTGIEVSEK